MSYRTVIDPARLDVAKERAGILTDKELAERTGMSTNTLVRLRKGLTFDSGTLDRLAEALQCSPIDLLVAEGAPEPFSRAPAVALSSAPSL